MSFEQQIRQAKDPFDALLVVGRGLDEVLAALANRSTNDSSGWGQWGGDEARGGSHGEPAAPSPPEPEFYGVRPAEPDHAAIARAEAALERFMNMYERQPNRQTYALVEQAQNVLLKLQEPGEYLMNSGDIIGDTDLIKVDESDPEQVVVDLPPASDELKAHRRALAEQIDLPSFFGPLWHSTPELREQIIEAYERGGPLWLNANRLVDDHDIMQQLPPAAKTVMVADIHQFSPRMAWEFQRDVMKTEDAEGAGLGVAQDNLDGQLAGAHVPLRGGD